MVTRDQLEAWATARGVHVAPSSSRSLYSEPRTECDSNVPVYRLPASGVWGWGSRGLPTGDSIDLHIHREQHTLADVEIAMAEVLLLDKKGSEDYFEIFLVNS
jgi:hypothetical protein